jgi:hypothetical protein
VERSVGTGQVKQINIAELNWEMVVLSRRSWTALSVAIMALMGWALFLKAQGRLTSPWGWSFVLVAGISGTLWIQMQHSMSQIRRKIQGAQTRLTKSLPAYQQ